MFRFSLLVRSEQNSRKYYEIWYGFRLRLLIMNIHMYFTYVIGSMRSSLQRCTLGKIVYPCIRINRML